MIGRVPSKEPVTGLHVQTTLLKPNLNNIVKTVLNKNKLQNYNKSLFTEAIVEMAQTKHHAIVFENHIRTHFNVFPRHHFACCMNTF